MSKGLEALNDILENTDVDFVYRYWGGDSPLDIVRKELEEYQHHEEILNDYGLTLANFREACLLLAMLKGSGRNIHNIDKQLKALEIIKEHGLADTLISYLKVDKTPNNWNWGLPKKMQITQEEFDLIKEVLL